MTQPHAYAPEADTALREMFWMTPPNESYTLDLDSMRQVAMVYNDYLRSFARDSNLPMCDLAH